MKKWIVMGVAVTALLVPAASAQASDGAYSQATRCTPDGWRGVFKVRAAHNTTCGTAHKVLNKWMNKYGLEGPVRVRVGRDGVLWTCHGYRPSGRLNPWWIQCWSSQKQWHYNRQGSWYSVKGMWFTYRA